MFKFLSLFRRSNDEQLNDNDYDFNEVPLPPGVQGGVESRQPALTENTFGGQQERPAPTISLVDRGPQKQAEQSEIDQVRKKLHNISDHPPETHIDTPHIPDSPFNVSGIAHELIEKHRPAFVGNGGENIVYVLPDHPSIVIKVEVEPLMTQIDEAEKEGRPVTSEVTPKQREELEKRLVAENASLDELRSYFGKNRVPVTRRSIRSVPVSRDTLEAVYRAHEKPVPNIDLATNEMTTIVAAQENISQISDPNSLDVRGGFSERMHPGNLEFFKQDYEAVTQALICDPESSSLDLHQFLVLYPGLETIVTQADANPQLRASLTDFVQRAIDYSKQTGKGLDLAGAKNILFIENADNSWDYKLVDALSPYSEQALGRMKGIMGKIVAKEPLMQDNDSIDDELFSLTCAINYIRTVNGLAKHLGIDDYVDMLQGQTITPSEFWEALQERYPGSPTQQQ